jgi:DNA-binding transcriptional ArsR family regulator
MAELIERTDSYEAIFTALAHPSRRRILVSLNFAGGEMRAGQIAGLFGHAWPTITRHLKLMTSAGILEERRDGRSHIYRLKTRRLALARDWLDWFERDPVTAKEKKDGQNDQREHTPVPAQHRSGRP